MSDPRTEKLMKGDFFDLSLFGDKGPAKVADRFWGKDGTLTITCDVIPILVTELISGAGSPNPSRPNEYGLHPQDWN